MWAATGLSRPFTGCSPKCLDPGGLHMLDALLEALSTSDHSSAAAEPAPMTVPWARASAQGFCEPQHCGHCCFCIISAYSCFHSSVPPYLSFDGNILSST